MKQPPASFSQVPRQPSALLQPRDPLDRGLKAILADWVEDDAIFISAPDDGVALLQGRGHRLLADDMLSPLHGI